MAERIKNLQCQIVKEIENMSEQDFQYYVSTAKAKIYSAIGVPLDNSGMLSGKAAQDEKRRYESHVKLFDMMYDRVMSLGSSDLYQSVETVDEFMTMFKTSHEAQLSSPSVDLNDVNYTRANWAKNWFKRTFVEGRTGIFGKTINPLKPLSFMERILITPPRLLLSRDQEGVLYNLVQKITTFSDTTQGAASSFKRDIRNIQSGLQGGIESYYSYKDQFKFLLGGWGDSSDWVFTRDGNRRLMIVGANNESFDVRFVETDDEGIETLSDTVESIPRAEVDLNEESIKQKVGQAFHRVYKEVLAGKTRYIVPKHIPSGSEAYLAFLETAEGKHLTRVFNDIRGKLAESEKQGKPFNDPRVHEITDRYGTTYKYIMYKTPETQVGERYHAYIYQSIDADGTKLNYFKKNMGTETSLTGEGTSRALEDIIPEGWHTAQEHRRYSDLRIVGKRYNGENIYSDIDQVRAYTGFEKTDQIPTDLEDALWNAVHKRRKVNKRFWKKGQAYIKKTQRRLQVTSDYVSKQLRDSGLTDEEVDEMIGDVMSIGGYKANIYRDPNTGTIKSSLDWAQQRPINYDPTMFYEGDYEDVAGQERDFLMEKIEQIQGFLDTDDAQDKESKDSMEAYLVHLQGIVDGIEATLKRISGAPITGIEDQDEVDIINKPVHFKHLGSMMNHMDRRTDTAVDVEYFDKSIQALQINEIKVHLLQALLKMPHDKDMADYLIRDARVAFGDPNYQSDIIDNESMAKAMNKVTPKWWREKRLGENKDFTASDVQFYTMFNNLHWTSKFLNWFAALPNNFQRLNPVINYGFKLVGKSMREWANRDSGTPRSNMFKEAVENTGVLELLNAFNEMLMGLHSADPTFRDFAPLKKVEALAILNLGHREFVDKGHTKIDAFIKRAAGLGASQQDFKRLKQLRGTYWQLTHPSSEMDAELVEDRLKKLVRNISKKQLRRATVFTLKWFPVKSGEKFMTFSGVEESLRAETAIAAILHADELGVLPKGEDRFKSPEAVSIARNAVYNMQFGMSPQFMTTAFGGPMKGVMQFKGYIYFQTLHDKKVIENFVNSARGQGATDIASRMMDAMRRMGKNERKQKGDEELIKVYRFMATRVVASMVGVLFEFFKSPAFLVSKGLSAIIPIAAITRNPLGSIYRGGESPLLGFTLRSMFYMMLFGMFDDDDDDRFMTQVRRFFLPPFITVLLETFIKAKNEKLWIQDFPKNI